MIAAESVAKSPADGYTFLVASGLVFTLNPHLYSKVPYDTVRDFLPVTRLVTANLMLVTRPDFPATNMRDLIDYVKKPPASTPTRRSAPAASTICRWLGCRTSRAS